MSKEEESFVKIAIVANKHTVFGNEIFQKKMESHIHCEVTFLCEDNGTIKSMQKVKELSPDMLITVNLEGFEQSTLTDNISYNLLDCKQIHFIFDKNLPNERYLIKPLSISMFFYCTDDEYCKYLLEKYPDIPYLKTMNIEGIEQDSVTANVDALWKSVCEVMKICKLEQSMT